MLVAGYFEGLKVVVLVLDMLFVEFAVNDDQDGDQGYNDALRGMEGIIAQARKHNPNIDIVLPCLIQYPSFNYHSSGDSIDTLCPDTMKSIRAK